MSEDDSSGQVICRVAYALNRKKLRAASVSAVEYEEVKTEEDNAYSMNQVGPWCGGGLATIVGASSQKSTIIDGVEFSPWSEIEQEMSEKGIQIILHKLTSEIAEGTTGKANSRLKSIEDYAKKHPEVRVVDPFSSVGIVVSRLETNNCIRKVLENNYPHFFTQPNYAIVYSNEDATRAMTCSGLMYPVICKPEQACGVAESHAMNIVLDEKGFLDIPCPFVMQQYVNHGATFYKVYVIEEKVMVSRRASLPNFKITANVEEGKGREESEERVHVIPFDSRKAYPTLLNLHQRGIEVEQATSYVSCEDGDSLVPEGSTADIARLEMVAKELRSAFGLSLFGFDVVASVEAGTERPANQQQQLLVVDVNFFPSYKEVPDFPSQLRAFLRKCAGLPPWRK